MRIFIASSGKNSEPLCPPAFDHGRFGRCRSFPWNPYMGSIWPMSFFPGAIEPWAKNIRLFQAIYYCRVVLSPKSSIKYNRKKMIQICSINLRMRRVESKKFTEIGKMVNHRKCISLVLYIFLKFLKDLCKNLHDLISFGEFKGKRRVDENVISSHAIGAPTSLEGFPVSTWNWRAALMAHSIASLPANENQTLFNQGGEISAIRLARSSFAWLVKRTVKQKGNFFTYSVMASTTSCTPYPMFTTAIPVTASRYLFPSES